MLIKPSNQINCTSFLTSKSLSGRYLFSTFTQERHEPLIGIFLWTPTWRARQKIFTQLKSSAIFVFDAKVKTVLNRVCKHANQLSKVGLANRTVPFFYLRCVYDLYAWFATYFTGERILQNPRLLVRVKKWALYVSHIENHACMRLRPKAWRVCFIPQQMFCSKKIIPLQLW
jgi:hypothetical protein